MKITIYNKLRKYENYLYTAHYADYIRGLTAPQVQELSEIGGELGMPYKHNGCPKCMLNFMKRLAIPYFEQQKKLEENKKDKSNENKGQQRGKGKR